MSDDLEGYDPLADQKLPTVEISRFIEDSQKRDVLNILRSYTGLLDVFSEAIQNGIDACDLRTRQEPEGYEPKIWIHIDIPNGKLRFVDNGIGMSVEQIRFFVRPGMSFKANESLRGHKGVGATFLAYGYSSFTVSSKSASETVAVTLTGGRQWAENTTGNIPRPKFTRARDNIPELEGLQSGTSIEIDIGHHRDERPNLAWLNVTDPAIWFKLLRLRTPLGGVYLKSGGLQVRYTISVRPPAGDVRSMEFDRRDSEFYLPHEFAVCQRNKDLSDVKEEMTRTGLLRRELPHRIPMEFRNLDCLWNIWSQSDLLNPDGPFQESLTEDQKALIVQHDIHVYGCFVRSRTVWETFQKDELGIRPQFKVISGGLQLASDYMVQGDLATIPLTTAAGYQANSFIIVHFTNGNPDMGRKVFQPELKDLADEISRKVVGELRRYQTLLKPDTGAQFIAPSKELEEWKDAQKEWQRKNPLRLQFGERQLALISAPREEQDVIALFHEIVGHGVIRGLQFYSTGYNTRYDGLYRYLYDETCRFDSVNNFWGVDPRLAPGESGSLVLEYKLSLDGLIRDFQKEEKNPQEVSLLVCWQIGDEFKNRYEIISFIADQEGGTRETFGATHALYTGSRHNKILEIICLGDFLGWYEDPTGTRAKHKALSI